MRITATIQRRPYSETATVDRYHNPVPGYLPAEDFPVYGIEPQQSVEADELGRRAVLTGLRISSPLHGAKPGPHDRFEISGETWEVKGEVGTWDGKSSPVGGFLVPGGYVFNIERRTG